MVFQSYALYPHMTVYENMAFALKLRKVPKDEIRRRVTETARMLEIEPLLERKPKALSGGQRQRVAVGRAIVREPAAFLFDEPLSNLDARLRVTTRAELKRLHQRLRTTTIYVTHDQEEAMTLGDRIVVMKDGVIQQADTPLATYNHPANRFVAGFIGMPPMNFFDGMLKAVSDDLVFEEGTPGPSLSNGSPGFGGPNATRTAPAGAARPVEKTGKELTLTGNGFRLVLPRARAERLRDVVGRHVVLGVRPEHLTVRPVPGEVPVPLELTVHVIEPLGKDLDLYARTSLDHHVTARLDASEGLAAAADARATLYVDARKVHVFEPGDAGMNLSVVSTTEPSHAFA
jgi:multiple sugar transport system ATP-binding protein